MSYVKLLFLFIGQAIIVVLLLGLILGSESLLDLGFTGLISLVGGIAIAIFFIEGLIIGFIGGCKLLPRQTKMESFDKGKTWTIVKEKERNK